MFCSHVRYVCIYVCMYACMYQELLKTTTNSLCVCAHLANKADSDSDSSDSDDAYSRGKYWTLQFLSTNIYQLHFKIQWQRSHFLQQSAEYFYTIISICVFCV